VHLHESGFILGAILFPSYPTTLNALLLCSAVLEIPFPTGLVLFSLTSGASQRPAEAGTSEEIYPV